MTKDVHEAIIIAKKFAQFNQHSDLAYNAISQYRRFAPSGFLSNADLDILNAAQAIMHRTEGQTNEWETVQYILNQTNI